MALAAWAAWAKRCYKLHCIFVVLPKSYLLNGEDTLNRNHNSECWNDATETRRLVLLLTHPWNAILVVGIKKKKKEQKRNILCGWLKRLWLCAAAAMNSASFPERSFAASLGGDVRCNVTRDANATWRDMNEYFGFSDLDLLPDTRTQSCTYF